MAEPMTRTQASLLAEIQEAGILYIRRHSQPHRTVEALERRGLVRCVEPDYSLLRQDGWKATTDG